MATEVSPDRRDLRFGRRQRALAQMEAAGGPSVTVDMLNDMIRKKPDNVGLALRDWMSNGENR